MSRYASRPGEGEHTTCASGRIDASDLKATIAQVLDRRPCAGLAVAVIADGALAWFHGHGLADVAAKTPITEDTVFRIASLTKIFTAVAVMQLWEQGLVDLDAPATTIFAPSSWSRRSRTCRPPPSGTSHIPPESDTGDGSRTYFSRASVRATERDDPGRGPGGLLPPRPARGGRAGDQVGVQQSRVCRARADRRGVARQPLDRYLRDYVFDPLGLGTPTSSDRNGCDPAWLPATCWALGASSRSPIARSRPWRGRDVLDHGHHRYVAALLRMAAGARLGAQPETVATMFQPHFQPDPRVPGMGLGFELGEQGGHKTVGKTGILSGFHSAIALAPEEGIGVIVFSNTGGLDGRGAPTPLATALLRRLLGLPVETIRTDVAPRPEIWSEVCGWYGPPPGPVTNLFSRALMGAGAEVSRRQSDAEATDPDPSNATGFRLYPDDPDDPWVFRIHFPEFGMERRVVFVGGSEEQAATRLLLDMMSFEKRPAPAIRDRG